MTTLDNILPIYAVEDDCIISKQGDVTIAFALLLPEIFTLATEEYREIHQAWVKALRVLPKNTVIHKQDWYILERYTEAVGEGKTFLKKAAHRHFEGMPIVNHWSYLFITWRPERRKNSTSLFHTLTRKNLVPEELTAPDMLQPFFGAVSQFSRLLQDSGHMSLTRLGNDQLAGTDNQCGVIEKYLNLHQSDRNNVLYDISFDSGIQVGDKNCLVYSLTDVEDLPATCSPHVIYEKYSTDKTKFPIGFTTPLGLLTHCNHIYNQFIVIGDSAETLKRLEKKRLRLQSLANYSRENAIAEAATNDFLNEAISEQRLTVKAHFNIIAWADNETNIRELKNRVTSALAQIDAVAKLETVGAPQLFWSCIPGNGGDLPVNEMFDTFAEQASCFLIIETNYRSTTSTKGIRFCDRLFGRPIYIDLFDDPRKLGITTNMGVLICGSSGSGKSFVANHILNTVHDQNAHCVIIDIGNSYKGLCSLVDGYYFTYNEQSPIRFNPFFLMPGEKMDIEKKESLKALLIALWKQEHEDFIRSEYIALSNTIQGYYQYLQDNRDIFPCFNTFFEYLETEYAVQLRAHNIKDKDFDINNFLFVLRPYYKGGEFDYLLNATEQLDLLTKPLIVFELDNIKDHPILFPVVTLVIMELFISKMRKLGATRKVLFIDEAWKAIAKAGTAEFIRYAFKTIRKYNGVPGVISQELEDLIDSPIVKDAIVGSADIKILMDMRKSMHKYGKIQEVLGLSDKAKTIHLSASRNDREIFIALGSQRMLVVKNQLSPEEYWAYTTDGEERITVQEYAEKYGSIEAGITKIIEETKS